jgi:hypothetical protein
MNDVEAKAREACKAAGLDPDEVVFDDRYDPDGEIVHQAGTGFILGVKCPRWHLFRNGQRPHVS